jgi:hypothetical protein
VRALPPGVIAEPLVVGLPDGAVADGEATVPRSVLLAVGPVRSLIIQTRRPMAKIAARAPIAQVLLEGLPVLGRTGRFGSMVICCVLLRDDNAPAAAPFRYARGIAN